MLVVSKVTHPESKDKQTPQQRGAATAEVQTSALRKADGFPKYKITTNGDHNKITDDRAFQSGRGPGIFHGSD